MENYWISPQNAQKILISTLKHDLKKSNIKVRNLLVFCLTAENQNVCLTIPFPIEFTVQCSAKPTVQGLIGVTLGQLTRGLSGRHVSGPGSRDSTQKPATNVCKGPPPSRDNRRSLTFCLCVLVC